MSDGRDDKNVLNSIQSDVIEQCVKYGLTATAENAEYSAGKRLILNYAARVLKAVLALGGMFLVNKLTGGFATIVYTEEQLKQFSVTAQDIESLNNGASVALAALLIFAGFLYRTAIRAILRLSHRLRQGAAHEEVTAADTLAFPIGIGCLLMAGGLIAPYVTEMGDAGLWTAVALLLIDGFILIGEDYAGNMLDMAEAIRDRADKFELTASALGEIRRDSSYSEYINGQMFTIEIDASGLKEAPAEDMEENT